MRVHNQLQIDLPNDDARLVQRQALAGMIWSKQHFHYDVPEWLHGDPSQPPPPPERIHGRNHEWKHLNNADLVSMPDKWEYPWYAAWDLAIPHRRPRPRRHRIRQVATPAHDAGMASFPPTSGLSAM
jgi:hypothetical protein